jgi:hypothetical protein
LHGTWTADRIPLKSHLPKNRKKNVHENKVRKTFEQKNIQCGRNIQDHPDVWYRWRFLGISTGYGGYGDTDPELHGVTLDSIQYGSDKT